MIMEASYKIKIGPAPPFSPGIFGTKGFYDDNHAVTGLANGGFAVAFTMGSVTFTTYAPTQITVEVLPAIPGAAIQDVSLATGRGPRPSRVGSRVHRTTVPLVSVIGRIN